jgi:hypothetical protein
MSGHLLIQSIAESVDRQKLQIVTFHPGQILSDTARAAGLDESSAPFDDGMFSETSTAEKGVLEWFILINLSRESTGPLGCLGVNAPGWVSSWPFCVGSMGCR